MARRLLLVLVLALVGVASGAGAADTFRDQMDWREGGFLVGMAGAGEYVFPGWLDAPDHERLSFTVNPCHRDLELDLEYEPPGATLSLADTVEATFPFRFRITLEDPDGDQLVRYNATQPDHGYGLPVVDAPGTYTLQLELLEGAVAEWRARVQGWDVDDPSCELWLNEVEANPSGPDAGNEWVEIYNEGSQAFDVAGWQVASGHQGQAHTIEEDTDTVVPAEGYHRVDLDPDVHLDDENERVQLLAPEGASLDGSPTLNDTADDGDTWQREGDGLGDWIFAPGTPGEPNAEAS